MSRNTTNLITAATMVSCIALFAGQAFAQTAVDDTARGKAAANSQGIASVEDRVTTLEGVSVSLHGQINTEIGNRQAADAALQTAIDTIALTPGPKGDTGPAGAQGLKGGKGDQGIQGSPGLKGDKGDKGETGLQGPQGSAGTVDANVIADLQGQIDDLLFDLATNTVFVTSFTFQGNLGSTSGADEICNGVAGAADLNGNYKAWLSEPWDDDLFTSAGDDEVARSRLTHSGRPYVRTDGVTVAANWVGLTSGSLDAPINRDENGNLVPDFGNPYVWTGTDSSGDEVSPDSGLFEILGDGPLTNNCFQGGIHFARTTPDSSAVVGLFNATDEFWSAGLVVRCDAFLHLYCVEQ